jgi:2-keto-4-pentenoate hydratase/2-oxohepta-3-ene-1,7-dioic acid hydratase in catechol pathway
MKLAMFRCDAKKGIAVAKNSEFFGFTEDMAGYPGDIDSLLAAGKDLNAVGEALLAGKEIDLASCEYLPPLTRSSKIICVGLNYADHSKEIGFAPLLPHNFQPFPVLPCGAQPAGDQTRAIGPVRLRR